MKRELCFSAVLLLAASSTGVDAVPQALHAPAPVLRAEQKARVAGPSLEDRRKLRILDEVLLSKNDNDPRLDHELARLSEGTKALFRERYRSLAPESRNARGTIVFLLGRNLTEPRDFDFLETVLSEPPCLSLGDCSREAREDSEGGVTLVYPQMVALYSLERDLQSDPPEEVRKLMESAARSPVPMVAERAQRLLERL